MGMNNDGVASLPQPQQAAAVAGRRFVVQMFMNGKPHDLLIDPAAVTFRAGMYLIEFLNADGESVATVPTVNVIQVVGRTMRADEEGDSASSNGAT